MASYRKVFEGHLFVEGGNRDTVWMRGRKPNTLHEETYELFRAVDLAIQNVPMETVVPIPGREHYRSKRRVRVTVEELVEAEEDRAR